MTTASKRRKRDTDRTLRFESLERRELMTGSVSYDPDVQILAIDGTNGNDTIFGDSEDHRRDGGDIIMGGNGNDKIDGQGGADKIWGGTGDDTIKGGNHNNQISGQDGVDYIFGEYGNDTLLGGRHDDVLDGGAWTDALYGQDGNDRLRGKSGFDFLYGQKGNDSLISGGGRDVLCGGPGADRFLMVAGGRPRAQAAHDASIYFANSTARRTQREIEVIDRAFGIIVNRTGSTRLLRDSTSNRPLWFLNASK